MKRHLSADDLGQRKSEELVRRHLRAACAPCDRAFRDLEQERLAHSRKRENGIAPLHRTPVSREVATLVTDIYQSPDRQEAVKRTAARSDVRHKEVILAMLAEARKARTLGEFQAWATLASHYALAAGIGKAEGLGCLTAAFLAEAARRGARPEMAEATIRSAILSLAEGGVDDPVVQAEVHFGAGKTRFESGAPIDRWMEEHFGRAAQHFASVGDAHARGQTLLFQAACKRLEGNPDSEWVPVGMVAEALSLVSPSRFEASLCHLLLETGHGFCDGGNAGGAADVILLLERLGTFKQPPLTLLSLMWLLARQAEAEGDSGAARLHYVECLSLLEDVYRSLRAILEIRTEQQEG